MLEFEEPREIVFKCDFNKIFSSYIDDALPKANLKRPSVIEIQKKLKSWANKCGISLDQKTTRMKERDKKVVSKSFHLAGIVVPLDDTGVGYRPLPETPGMSYS